MFIVERVEERILSLPAREVSGNGIKSLSSGLAQRIALKLSDRPMYVIELAKALKVHEQRVYYHIRQLEKAGIVREDKHEPKAGAVAKYYRLTEPAFIMRFKEMEESHKQILPKDNPEFLKPFIENDQFNANIIVGSPDPHGPEKARSRDGYYGIDLALFIGSFLSYTPMPSVRLDTEVRDDDLKKNLIIIGGPIVNKITAEINRKMPIFFDQDLQWAIHSSVSGNTYPSDESGLIVKSKNPYNHNHHLLLVAGKRYSGTRAAIIGFLKKFDDISKGNVHDRSIKARVVEGVDLDSDGLIDSVEIRE